MALRMSARGTADDWNSIATAISSMTSVAVEDFSQSGGSRPVRA